MATNKFEKFTKGQRFTIKARPFNEYLNAVNALSTPGNKTTEQTKFKEGQDRSESDMNLQK